ncbi:TIGR04190 family B12-binding domain/radical SAM domain protein [candidate division KSB1 bacterium]|nr:TIGR04190 family B12-binding domain/radical SAM domain protein [candidate division KSB1 bacterium]
MIYKPDLILLHAPSIYDFRKTPKLFGPISDVVPSTPIFEMYPVGFSSIAEHLERRGIGVRIVNLAYRMLTDTRFDAEKFIKKLHPLAFGIDLHWLVHAQGSVEVAKICKRLHPHTPVIMGGLSSTYFHEEILEHPEIDFVIRGDSAEQPILELMTEIKKGTGRFEAVPNLSWRDEKGQVRINEFNSIPDHVDEYSNNYKNLFKIAVKYGDIRSMTAIYDWWRYPITAIMTCRGCTHNCIICGGSHQALKSYANRKRIAFRSPELIVDDIRQMAQLTGSPIFIIGDLNQTPVGYRDVVFEGMRRIRVKNEVVVELFAPAPRSYFNQLAECISKFNIEISPESHDEAIRRRCGKHYSNAAMEENIEEALDNGCGKFDIFFMIGLPEQTEASVMQTLDYCEYLLATYGKRVVPFIAPLAPFLDPGSIAYEQAESYGYRLLFKRFEDYRKALMNPSWKYFLNYETDWLSRDQIVNITYYAGKRLNRMKHEVGLIGDDEYKRVDTKIEYAQNLIAQIDAILKIKGEEERERQLVDLQFNIEKDSIATICDKEELKWPMLRSGFRFFHIAKAVLFG